jgi:hypothetical protein
MQTKYITDKLLTIPAPSTLVGDVVKWDGVKFIVSPNVDAYTKVEADAKYSLTGHSHTIADVTGLQTALDGKSATTHDHDAVYQSKLVSGTNIKTVNGQSLLGTGDVTVSGSSFEGLVYTAANNSLNMTGSTATGSTSVGIGQQVEASGNQSFASNYQTKALGQFSHAEGYRSQSSHYASHAEGYETKALGWGSHSQGYYTTASGLASHASGLAYLSAEPVKAVGRVSFNHSEVKTNGMSGATGDNSSILGGVDHNITSTGVRSAIIGGSGITATAPDTVYVPNLRVQGTILDFNGNPIGVSSSTSWNDITGKPATFTPSSHSHTIADVTGLQTELNNRSLTGHSHVIADVTGLQTTLDNLVNKSDALLKNEPLPFMLKHNGVPYLDKSNDGFYFGTDTNYYSEAGVVTDYKGGISANMGTDLWADNWNNTLWDYSHVNSWSANHTVGTYWTTGNIQSDLQVESKDNSGLASLAAKAGSGESIAAASFKAKALLSPEGYVIQEIAEIKAGANKLEVSQDGLTYNGAPLAASSNWSAITNKPTINNTAPDVNGNYTIATSGGITNINGKTGSTVTLISNDIDYTPANTTAWGSSTLKIKAALDLVYVWAQGSAGLTLANTFTLTQTAPQINTDIVQNRASVNNARVDLTSTGVEARTSLTGNVALRVINTISTATANLTNWVKGSTIMAFIDSMGWFNGAGIRVNGRQDFVNLPYVDPTFLIGVRDIPLSEITKLTTSTNWTGGKYTGTPITNTFNGQSITLDVVEDSVNKTYRYFADEDNKWFRIAI